MHPKQKILVSCLPMLAFASQDHRLHPSEAQPSMDLIVDIDKAVAVSPRRHLATLFLALAGQASAFNAAPIALGLGWLRGRGVAKACMDKSCSPTRRIPSSSRSSRNARRSGLSRVKMAGSVSAAQLGAAQVTPLVDGRSSGEPVAISSLWEKSGAIIYAARRPG